MEDALNTLSANISQTNEGFGHTQQTKLDRPVTKSCRIERRTRRKTTRLTFISGGDNREFWREYRRANRDRVAVSRHNGRARRLGIPGQITEEEWLKIKQRWEGRCAYCGTSAFPLQIDHVKPLSKYKEGMLEATNEVSNILPCCPPCNRAKSNMPLEMFLLWREGKLN